jgi:hypothetical protein
VGNPMKLSFIAIVAVTVFAGCTSQDARLEGTWKSNRALTMATIENLRPRSQPLTPSTRTTLSGLFGRLTVSYNRGVVVCNMPSIDGRPDIRTSYPYRIVAADADSLVYIARESSAQKPELNHIYFDGPNRYWIYLHQTGIKECFDRIAPPLPRNPQSETRR